MDLDLEALARRAAEGDRFGLDELVQAVRDDVYSLALRMLGHPADAEDASLEILIKIVTRLGGFRGESAFRTWVWRVACNHLLSVRRARPPQMSDATPRDDAAPQPAVTAPAQDEALLDAQVRTCCINAMLRSLDADQRTALILAELFGLKSEEGAEVLGIKPAAFRKRLSRAKERMRADIGRHCGVLNSARQCKRCGEHAPAPEGPLDEMDDLNVTALQLRLHVAAPGSLTDGIRDLLRSGRYRMFHV
jgi:RNA polymerase sigma factor (sigma-70 family)